MRETLLVIMLTIGLVVGIAPQEQETEPDYSLNNPSMYFYLVRMPEIQKELELSDAQLVLLQSAFEKYKDLSAKHYQQTSNLSFSPDQRELGREDRVSARKDYLSKASSHVGVFHAELLPHQKKRLEQAAFQHELMVDGKSSDIYQAPKLVQVLSLSAKQKRDIGRIVEKQDKEIEAEYKKFLMRVQEIRSKSHDQILDTLSENQTTKLADVIGKPIDFSSRANIR